MTKKQKTNLLEFLNRSQLVGKEAITIVNLMYAVAGADEEEENHSVATTHENSDNGNVSGSEV